LPPSDLIHHLATYLPRQLWLLKLIKNTAGFETRGMKVVVLLSSDTEFDPPIGDGTWKERSSSGLLDGLPRFLETCELYNAPATLFCEGKLVQDLPDLFLELSRDHEIGCHSFAHEWLGTGPPPRWIPHRDELAVLPTQAKARVMKRAAKSIQDNVKKKPRSFKAPFNSVDHPSTLALLNEIGFENDSSLPSYSKESLFKPLRSVNSHHASAHSLWSEGTMRLVEVPFMIRPRPLFLHPFDVREEIMNTVSRSMKLALECVDIQCRIDLLHGKDMSMVHITSHPWEFSKIRPYAAFGQANADRLVRYLDRLSTLYDLTFQTVGEYSRIWEKEYCPLHSKP
jgi:peptidoglycan/xylan/chitin deacetylase (PgdA/CDA1 family)